MRNDMCSLGSIDGNTVEDFLAALLLLRFPDGTRITPSQGDQGVDIKVPNQLGYDVYQVKKYASALDSGQLSKVKDSWNRVNAEFGATNTITAWYLVMPWDPTAEREKWFKELTAGAAFPCEWKGLAHVNGWAADNPRLVEYFFGQGYERLQQMIAALTLDSSDGEGGSGDARLEAVTNRYRKLQEVIDGISPFYRYRLALVPAAELVAILGMSGGVAHGRPTVTTYRRVSDDYYVEICISPISEEAAAYDPISLLLTISPDDTNAAELEHFYEYGIAPAEPVAAEVVEAHGPPGSIPQLAAQGTVRLADVEVPSPWESIALYSFTSEAADGDEGMLIIEMGPLTTTEGQKGRAIRAQGQALGMELRIGPDDGAMSLSTWAVPLQGKLPHRVLPELEFAQRLWSGKHAAALSVPNGPALVKATRPPARPDDANGAAQWAEIAAALAVLQRFSLRQLKMPHKLSAREWHTIRSAAELTINNTAEVDWENFRIVSPAMPLDGPAAILAYQPLRIAYDNQTFELDATIRQECDLVEAVEVTSEFILVRPRDNAKLRQSLVARSELDYRVLAKPLGGVDPGTVLGPSVARSTQGVRGELTRLSVGELRSIARERGLTRYSKLRKAELVEALTT
ncbi:Rho termination factor N-terminal domain-containing protein [Mycobacterium sp. E3198]|uniref:Rho termination factor N-terminal domain-containing protein n=1 Tax=Mycobacterium sp. E3198 TaxID=1834143 RepID=UPI0009EF630C|nr:Rho termination factor N-terminal domain-containing protein [Mycobacterium sp. E3198]